jgi:hypothetical protein
MESKKFLTWIGLMEGLDPKATGKKKGSRPFVPDFVVMVCGISS